MPELLIELFCEEIPARMQRQAAADFARLLGDALRPLGAPSFATSHGPRRIATVGEVTAATEATATQERGPRANAPAAALAGFLKKHGAAQEQLRQEGDYWVLEKSAPAIAAEALIARELPGVIRKLPWPKSMRWGGSGDFTFARPLRRVLCLFDGRVVHVPDLPAGLAAGDVTEGHRFLHPGIIKVASHTEYGARLREACVIVDAEERKRLISEGSTRVAGEVGLSVVEDAGLLEEVAGLMEWPVPMLGRIDAQFMDLPPEVLRTSMRVNQRYFATTYADGKPAPHFVVIANVPGSDGGAAIVAGNERVLRARFSDARFFWDQDRKQPLAAFLPKLATVTFHAKLGSLRDKVSRLPPLALSLGNAAFPDHFLGAIALPEAVRSAAELCKADLATGMVGEFPELQGIIGSYYVVPEGGLGVAGDLTSIAQAIREHYAPRGPSDPCPTHKVTVLVSLADKLDTLVGFFGIDERPTGSGDPFGLRRAAIGIIRLVVENMLRLDLTEMIFEAFKLHREQQSEDAAKSFGLVVASDVMQSGFRPNSQLLLPPLHQAFSVGVLNFLADRLRVKLRDEGARHDILSAILARGVDSDFVRLLARVDALERMLGTGDGANLLAAYKRAANILRIENRKDGPHEGRVDISILVEPAEIDLASQIELNVAEMQRELAQEEFLRAMFALAALRPKVDAFFDAVTVNSPDPKLRANRLRLLASLCKAMDDIADFSKIEG
jgi:glycyl-tRNA synthetase beta chain